MTVPAEHHEVGAGGVAREHPGRMPVDDVVTDSHVRVLLAPRAQRGRQAAGGLGRDPAPGQSAAAPHRPREGAARPGTRTRCGRRPGPRGAAPLPRTRTPAPRRCPAGRGCPRRSRGARPCSLPGPRRPGTRRGWRRICSPSPSTIAAKPPAPRAPTTSMDASAPLSATATAGGPASRPVVMGSPWATSSARVMADVERARGYPAQGVGDRRRCGVIGVCPRYQRGG